MTLPDGALAYRVLNSANLDQEEMKLCRATINELKYDAMVKQLLRIYGFTKFQFHQALQIRKIIFKESVCSTAEIQNQHKNYTKELHKAEEKAITAIRRKITIPSLDWNSKC